jgi:hypothetical protein
MIMHIRLAAGAALAAALFVAACDDDDDDEGPSTPTVFNVVLTDEAEVNDCAAAGANAAGTATVTINAANTTITVTNLTFTGLSGPATMAHIHFGAANQNGNIAIDFGATAGSPLVSPFSGTFDSGDYLAPSGAPSTFAGFITSMKNDQSYINIHTAACPNGEIRGQLIAP